MKLKDYAKLKGIAYSTAYLRWKTGKLEGVQSLNRNIEISRELSTPSTVPIKVLTRKKRKPIPPALLSEIKEIIHHFEKNYKPYDTVRLIYQMSGYPLRRWKIWANNQASPMTHTIKTIHMLYEALVKNKNN